MSVADYVLNGLGSMLKFGINLLPVDISVFTVSDLNSSLTSISNFWVNSFSVGSHFFPFALFFVILILILFMELSLLIFKVIKFTINILRGSGG